MEDNQLRYDRMVESALRNVVRQALEQVAEQGLPGDHHFYITFATQDPGVTIPDSLRAQYPEEMTIVLQHQYYGLEVDDHVLKVTLSFSNRHERLIVPLAAITSFADPSVNFALHFQSLPSQEPDPTESAEAPAEEQPAPEPPESAEDASGKVVTLDRFRKK